MSHSGAFLMLLGGLFLAGGTIRAGLSSAYLARLHFLGVADTLGGILILAGLMLRHPGQTPLLLVALGGLVAWGPILTYLMAEGGAPEERAGRGHHV